MNLTRTILMGGLMMGLSAALLWADEYQLTGTLRDFRDTHPDFENTYNGVFGLERGMVKDQLGEANKPVLNIGQGGCYKVSIVSHKDISNVVLKLDDGTEYKYDDLDQEGVGEEASFEVPGAHAGKTVVGAWVKAGNNKSGDGPGYGEYFESLYGEINESHDVVNGSETITVTFICQSVIDPQWRVESEETFNQWFRNTQGVNAAIPFTIVLDNGRDRPGGVYRFEASRRNGKQFFPIDDELSGNEGRSHNYHFTYEIATRFTYTDPVGRDPMELSFSGDDDVWLFINGKLVIDLGGVHAEEYDWVNLDSRAAELGLEPGGVYDFNFFFSERHTQHSNFTLETTFPFLSSLYD